MLNISTTSIRSKIDINEYNSFRLLKEKSKKGTFLKVIFGIILIVLLSMLLPWTQTIRSNGYLTTAFPEERPQHVQALIGGKINKWYVSEGDTIQKGDTILVLTEVKEEYLDTELLKHTGNQIDAKEQSIVAYQNKVKNLRDQIEALESNLTFKQNQNKIKLDQIRLKIQSDSLALVSMTIETQNAKNQFDRYQELFDKGIKSRTEYELKQNKWQAAEAKKLNIANKIDISLNENDKLLNEASIISNDFRDKISKLKGEIQTTISKEMETVTSLNKLLSSQNQYITRGENYVITSPIDGMVNKILPSGIGEIIKNGEKVISIVPVHYQFAVEMYVEPVDIPLLEIGQDIRILFDGWPAIIFSGWPNNSYGTFNGSIYAIDTEISENGKYRILALENDTEKPWPKQLRIGSGANSIILLKNVLLGYELWRKMNGFPPDYYKKEKSKDIKTKAPLRKIK